MKEDGSFQIWFVVALGILTACSVYLATATALDHQLQVKRHAIYQEHAQQMQTWLTREQHVITGALDSYHADAYDSGVDRIAEQQLLAAEYQMLLLQVIARQNTAMLELMTVIP